MAYQNIAVQVTGTSLSALVDNPGFGLHYTCTSGSGNLPDVTALLTNIATKITSFSGSATHSLSYWWGMTISRTSNTGLLRAYDITGHEDGTAHGSPIAQVTFTPSAHSGAAIYAEGVAAVITLQAPYGTDVEFAPGARPRARDRGRIYFGPLDASAVNQPGSNNQATLAPGFQTDALGFIKSAYSYVGGGGATYTLSVWSRVAKILKPPAEAWMDERPDYQRRRVDQGVNKVYQALP